MPASGGFAFGDSSAPPFGSATTAAVAEIVKAAILVGGEGEGEGRESGGGEGRKGGREVKRCPKDRLSYVQISFLTPGHQVQKMHFFFVAAVSRSSSSGRSRSI